MLLVEVDEPIIRRKLSDLELNVECLQINLDSLQELCNKAKIKEERCKHRVAKCYNVKVKQKLFKEDGPRVESEGRGPKRLNWWKICTKLGGTFFNLRMFAKWSLSDRATWWERCIEHGTQTTSSFTLVKLVTNVFFPTNDILTRHSNKNICFHGTLLFMQKNMFLAKVEFTQVNSYQEWYNKLRSQPRSNSLKWIYFENDTRNYVIDQRLNSH